MTALNSILDLCGVDLFLIYMCFSSKLKRFSKGRVKPADAAAVESGRFNCARRTFLAAELINMQYEQPLGGMLKFSP